MFKFFRRKKDLSAEDAVCKAFCRTLDVDSIDPHANFFELGGDSMMATVVTALLEDFGHSVPSTAVFDHPTMADLTAFITGGGSVLARAGVPLVEVHARNASGPTRLPASVLQQRLWPFERNPDPERFQLRGEGAVLLHGPFDVDLLQRSLTQLSARQEALRSAFAEYADGNLSAMVYADCTIDVERHTAASHEEAAALVARVTAQVFDLSQPPPIRCAVITLSDAEHVLAVSMHHIVSDGWSMGVFVSELAEIYSALRTKRTPELPTLPFQFADYAGAHRTWLASDGGTASIAFWRDYLAGAPSALDVTLPADKPRGSEFNFPVRRTFLLLSDTTQHNLRAMARSTQSSVPTVFLAAFLTVYKALTGISDFPVGIMHANRNLPGTQNLIGFFATLVLLRLKMPGGGISFSEALDVARSETRRIDPHAAVPIGTLIDAGVVDTLPRVFVDSVPRPGLPQIDGVAVEDFPFEHPPLFAAADIALFLFDNGHELSCMLGTNTEMFSDSAAAALADALGSALAEVRPT
jgi:acyl carrier protein